MPFTRILLTVVLLAGAAVVGVGVAAYHPAIAPVGARPTPSAALVARGAELAAIGDCAVCHTAAGGAPLAGGRPIATPFGTVISTNLTPDPDRGIGAWSEAAFRRAMRDGVARDGSQLYPVLPYTHFTRASDADIGALYAFLTTRAPVATDPVPNPLPFPLNQRVLLAGWNLLFLRPGPWRPDPAEDALFNRGAYLAEAVGHCGACHTARNPLGAERAADTYAGGQAEGWPAPAIQIDSPAPIPWTEAAIGTYLATGYQSEHGAAAGPMTEVTRQLAGVPAADIEALAHYFAGLMPRVALPRPAAEAGNGGNAVAAASFAGACGACHAGDAPMIRAGAAPLSLSSAVNAATPGGVIQVILRGIPWRDGEERHYMPAYADALTDAQVAALAAYTRGRFTGLPPWNGLEEAVARARRGVGE